MDDRDGPEVGAFLGVDAGGTKTHAVLIDGDGRKLAEAVAGPGNPLAAGDEPALTGLRGALEEALARAPQALLCAAHFAVAGAGRSRDRRRVGALIDTLGLGCPVGLSDDARAAFYAAAEPPGAVLVCGTGAIAVAYGADGSEHRAGGHGFLVGDEGSGYWIGREAVRAALRSADGRAGPSPLVKSVPAALGCSDLEDVLSRLYAGEPGPGDLAGLARTLPADATAAPAFSGILEEAASELVLALEAALDRGGLEPDATVVLAGGMLAGRGPVHRAVESRLTASRPELRVITSEQPPAFGAARLALSAR